MECRKTYADILAWRDIFDTYHNVYMTRSLTKQMFERILRQLRFDREQIDMRKREMDVQTPYGSIHVKNRGNVTLVEYSAKFLEQEEYVRQKVEELEVILKDIIEEFSA